MKLSRKFKTSSYPDFSLLPTKFDISATRGLSFAFLILSNSRNKHAVGYEFFIDCLRIYIDTCWGKFPDNVAVGNYWIRSGCRTVV